MYPISVSTENLLRKRDRLWRIKAEIDGVEYAEDKVISFEIEQSIVSGQEFEIGAAASSRLVIRLRTNAEIPPNAKIVPYVALSADGITWNDADFAWEDADIPWEGGTTEWMPLGEFYVDSREKVNNTWEYTCYDKLMFANTPYVSSLSYPTTMQAVWDEICTQLGYTYDSSVAIDPSYMVPAAPTGYTCRQVMGFIAAANAACVYAGRDGVIRFKRFSATETPVFEMTPADYIRARLTNPVKSYSRVVVVYDPDDDLAYEAGTGDEDHTLYVDCPLATQQIADNLLAALNGFAYVPVEMDARGYPQLEHGDIISFETVESMSWEDADMSWDEADFPWDGAKQYQTIILHQVLDFRGGLSMQIEAPSKSEQQSEFPVEGTLTEAVNRLNRNAVRYEKPYYGVTHSRDEGIVVQREDGKAKAVFNADELAFYKGANKALYFDVQNDRYVFGGHLQAASGTFTGELQAATGTFAGTLQAASGTFTGALQGGTIEIGSGNNVFKADSNGIYLGNATFSSAPFRVTPSGQLTATNANITGTITGSFITGSSISGGVITGALIQTTGSYPRIELSSTGNLLAAYGANPNNTMSITPVGGSNVPQLQFREGSNWTRIDHAFNIFEIESTGDIVIDGNSVELTGGSIWLWTPGSNLIYVPSLYHIYSIADGKTLGEILDDL